jgi:two-component system invasion response regulator UvrY
MNSTLEQSGLLPAGKTFRVLVADDHAIIRIGLKLMIKHLFGGIHVEEAMNGETVIGKLKTGPFDLLILDINMPNTESFSLSGYILKEYPLLKILIFTVSRELIFAKRFLKLGVHGYLQKQTNETETQVAIRTVLSGKVFVSDLFVSAISEELIHPGNNNPFELLTDREFEVTLHILRGSSIAATASTLHLNRSTVGTHKSRIMQKLRLTNTIELIDLAKKYKIV